MSKQMYHKLTADAKAGIEKFLGELEHAVMNILWQRNEATVREVLAELNQTRSLAYTTVLTVMSRLVEKGLLVQDKTDRAHRYRPAMSREAYAAETTAQIIHSLVEDFGDIALAQFSQELDGLDAEHLAALKALAEGSADE